MTETRKTRATRAVAILWLVFATVMYALPSAAQDVITTDHEYTFGQVATFSISLPPASTVEEATLLLKIGTHTQTFPLSLEQGYGQYQHDLRQNPIPPFAPVTYRWEYEDTAGKEHNVDGDTFLYEDNRFDWQAQQDGAIEVKWVSGETSIMVKALDIAQEAATEIQNTLDTESLDAVTIYIYPSLPDLQSALRLTGREWVGGQAYPEYGILLLAIPPANEAILKMQRDVPHELTHKMLYDLTTPQGYATLPIWLVEGLATYYEQIPDPAFELAIKKAVDTDTLVPLETLCHPFTGEHEEILLAYAQSQSFLRYLQQTYGWTKLRDLVDDYADGLDCVTGSEPALTVDLLQLESDWQAWLTQKSPGDGTSAPMSTEAFAAMLRHLAPWFLLISILFLPGVVFWISTR